LFVTGFTATQVGEFPTETVVVLLLAPSMTVTAWLLREMSGETRLAT